MFIELGDTLILLDSILSAVIIDGALRIRLKHSENYFDYPKLTLEDFKTALKEARL